VAHFQENYPERLKHCIDGPLYYLLLDKLKNRRIISIVGTRQSHLTAQSLPEIDRGLAPLDPVIVSGFAYGVDIVAHQMAMDHNLQTIGVVAHGLNQIYPKTHKNMS
jgi:DNA processing protein